jgi:hypothetical protein
MTHTDLLPAVPGKRRPPLRYWEERLKAKVARSLADDEEGMEPSVEDRQGLGVGRQRSSRNTKVLGG